MNLHLNEFEEGFNEMLLLCKTGNAVFDQGNGNLFPTSNQQKMWRFAKGAKHLQLHDGINVHHFNVTSGNLDGEDADLERGEVNLHDFEQGAVSKGKAQIHRSDASHAYLTIQEGTKNPTYTLRHMGGNRWKAIAKKQKPKPTGPVVPSINVEQFQKAAFDLNRAAGQATIGLANGLVRLGLSPGEVRVPFTNASGPGPRGWEWKDALMAGGLGAGAGAAYHYGKKHLYNTPEENEQEEQNPNLLLTRMAIPGAGMAVANAGMNSLLTHPENDTGYYDQLKRGRGLPFFGDWDPQIKGGAPLRRAEGGMSFFGDWDPQNKPVTPKPGRPPRQEIIRGPHRLPGQPQLPARVFDNTFLEKPVA